MSFLDKINRFAHNPVSINHKRSKFNLNHTVSTTFNCGDIVPLMCQEVLPGDSFKLSFSSVVRMMTPALPTMDNAYIDFYAFWAPSRICCSHLKDWEKIFGENTSSPWAPSSESTIITTGNHFYLNGSSAAIQPQSLGDYMGFRIGFYKDNSEMFNFLPFNGYFFIYDEFFRDQNTQFPSGWQSWSTTQRPQRVYSPSYVAKACKFHDLFTSALPGPQRSATSVLLPLAGSAPVITSSTEHNVSNWSAGLKFKNSNNTTQSGIVHSNTGQAQAVGTASSGTNLFPSNLWADLTNATASSVNDLRLAFAIQKLLETSARGGARFKEYLYSFYGVSIPDNTLQRPEYLGGKRVPLNMMQVLQTAQDASSPLGTTGAFSNTADDSYLFTKSFPEHGYVYLLCVVRVNQSYCQGIPIMFKRLRQYDYYNPVFANLGEQSIKTYELYADNTTDFSEVFGYKEAWAEYRFNPSKVSGYLSPDSGDLITPKWTYVNNFLAKPVLNSSFMTQDKSQLDKTLAVENGTYQFIINGFVQLEAWREMPYFSIPGLIDHA